MAHNTKNYPSSHIITVQRGDESYLSSCVFITEHIALSAGHSVFDSQWAICEGRKSHQFLVHPQYNKDVSNYLNDLSLIVFCEKISPFAVIDSQFEGKKFERCGFGMRDAENKKKIFPVILKETHQRFCQFEDANSVIGDSGGGIYNERGELSAIHSTSEDTHSYGVKLSAYMDWITPYIDIFALEKLKG